MNRRRGGGGHRHGDNDAPPVPNIQVLGKTKSSSRLFQRPLVKLICATLGIALVVYAFTLAGKFFSLRMQIWRINQLSDLPKALSREMADEPELFWGTYRPHVLYGIRSRYYQSPVFGLAWFDQNEANVQQKPNIRHSSFDDVQRFGWVAHDGRMFGHQEIVDRGDSIVINTTFVKFCHPDPDTGRTLYCDWATRISATPTPNAARNYPKRMFSLLFYVSFDEKSKFTFDPHAEQMPSSRRYLSANVEGLGDIGLDFRLHDKSEFVNIAQGTGGMWTHQGVMQMINSMLRQASTNTNPPHYYLQVKSVTPPESIRTTNGFVYQLTFDRPVVLDIDFYNMSASRSRIVLRTERDINEAIVRQFISTKERFSSIFPRCQQAALSAGPCEAAVGNLIGGMGYFYGHSLVRHPDGKRPEAMGPVSLYTAVPCRSMFPRGFLWDEGFHLLVVARWDLHMAMDSLAHWLDLANIDGWIPREQILDHEMSAHVPDEFLVQRSDNANPPSMLVLLIGHIANLATRVTDEAEFRNLINLFRRAYPRIQLWFSWYLSSQSGLKPTTFRWRGRDTELTFKLNPRTLTSGLDDYPRASHPSEDEYHVDLRCWMAMGARTLSLVATLIGADSTQYDKMYEQLSDNQLLNSLHWNADAGVYADVGMHSTKVKLQKTIVQKVAQNGMKYDVEETRRVVKGNPTFGFVADTEGYVSLFPLISKILVPDSPQLGTLLENLKNSSKLWTKYGLRSLSASSFFYRKRNTEHDPPYWRGQIWININYLVLSGLKHYSDNSECPHRELAGQLYGELRKNVMSNVLDQYKRTGFFWEQYDDRDGHGMGAHPFTGWTSLVVLIADEYYD